MTATFNRRGTRPDTATLDEMTEQMAGREWTRDWATMIQEKRVVDARNLAEAIADFDRLVRPILLCMNAGHRLGSWKPGHGWEGAES